MIRQSAINVLKKNTSLSSNKIDKLLEIPPDQKLGDLAFPCFILGKNAGQTARELRQKIAVPEGFKKVEVAGPYLNFFYDEGALAKEVLTSKLEPKKKKEKILMDIFQANPYKPFHIGHIRNAVLGESLRRILEFNGAKTYNVSYVGDVGVHIAKWLWYYTNFYKGKIPKKDVSKWTGVVYAKAIAKAGKSKKYEAEINAINKLLDDRSSTIVPIWKKIRDICFDDADKIAEELACKIDKRIPESECEGPGKLIVEKLYKTGKLKKSQGAIGIELSKKLGFFICLKSDGTALYSTKDFGNLYIKNNAYRADKFVYVVGSEQEHYFKQLFEVFKRLKLSSKEHKHISYGLVSLKDIKMSSRLGNVITYEDLRDKMIAQAKKKNPKIAKQVAIGAMKYNMLKYSTEKKIIFDWKTALSFEGDTGPYLQYSLVRANKIIQKARPKAGALNYSKLKSFEEQDLLKHIARFPIVVQNAAEQYSPHLVANYTYQLAHKFARFYEKNRVIGSTAVKERLLLVKVFRNVLRKAINLLGIEEVSAM